jgi:hypothetical protein
MIYRDEINQIKSNQIYEEAIITPKMKKLDSVESAMFSGYYSYRK